jgi:hypothetical protein
MAAIMKTNKLLSRSFESIAYQKDGRFFSAVVEAMIYLRESDQNLTGGKNDLSLIKASGIERAVKKYSNISIKFKSDRNHGINAYVLPPDLDKNHPLLTASRRLYFSNADATKRLKKAKGSITGSMDLRKGTVSGVYADIVSEVFVSSQIVQETRFSVEEAAAIFLHEIGHLVSYYEYLGRSILLNHVMGDLVKAFNETDSIKNKVELVKVSSDLLDLNLSEPTAIASLKDGEAVQNLIVSEYINVPSSATNTRVYDYRNWEALADQYVSRLGGGLYLATGLDRLFRITGSTTYMSNKKFLVIETVSVLLLSTVGLPLFILLTMMVGFKETEELYDPPIDRVTRIRRDILNAMKESNVDKKYRTRLQNDIDVIDNLVEGLKDRTGVIDYIWKNIYGPNRKAQMRLKSMQKLESLANNELFVKANQLNLKITD